MIKNNKGQSTVEFVITFAFTIGLTFLFLSSSINYVGGYLVHYGNFVASRAYLTFDSSSSSIAGSLADAKVEAERVFHSYNLSGFGAHNVEVNSPLEVKPLFTGTVVTYKRKLSLVKFLTGNEEATLVSESFLGKEPMRNECLTNICKAMGDGSGGCSNTMDVTLYDNGC